MSAPLQKPSPATKRHTDDMDALRHVLTQVMDERGLNASSWSLKAGKSRNFLGEFLAGRSHDMTIGSLQALAKAANTDALSLMRKAFRQRG